jgi:hypothetical protein
MLMRIEKAMGANQPIEEWRIEVVRLPSERATRGVHEAQGCVAEEFQRMSLMGDVNLLKPGSIKRASPTLYGAGLH